MALLRTETPGILFDTQSRQQVDVSDYRVDDRYDTNVIASGAIAANTEVKFFYTKRGSASDVKDPIDANFPQENRIVGAGESMVVERLGVYVPTAYGNLKLKTSDLRKVADGMYMNWMLNRQSIAEGAAIRFAPGYGLGGTTQETAESTAGIGPVASGAVAKLTRTHRVAPDTQVEVIGKFHNHLWDATNMPTLDQKTAVKALFQGLLKVAQISNT